MLDRQAILGCEDFAVEALEVPEWGGSVFIRTMKASDRDSWEFDQGVALRDGKTPQNIRATLAVRCLCDKDGTLLFTKSDAAALGEKSAKALDRIYDAAKALNRLGDDDLDDLEKNLGVPLASDSDTD